jgi:hypothetical protein
MLMRASTPPIVAAFLALLASAGCASKIYIGPTSGRGAEQQLAVSTSAHRAFRGFDVEPLRGRAVAVEVYGLADKLEGLSPEEGFVRSLLVRRLVESGARVVEARSEADTLVSVSLDAAGVDVIRRDFPPIYHHTTFRGLTRGRLVVYTLREGSVVASTSASPFSGEAIFRESYIFYVFGPIDTGDSDEAP